MFNVTVDMAVECAHEGIMVDMGQVCCAGSRTYVQAGIYDEFVKRSAERAARRTVGSPFDLGNENGTLVGMGDTYTSRISIADFITITYN